MTCAVFGLMVAFNRRRQLHLLPLPATAWRQPDEITDMVTPPARSRHRSRPRMARMWRRCSRSTWDARISTTASPPRPARDLSRHSASHRAPRGRLSSADTQTPWPTSAHHRDRAVRGLSPHRGGRNPQNLRYCGAGARHHAHAAQLAMVMFDVAAEADLIWELGIAMPQARWGNGYDSPRSRCSSPAWTRTTSAIAFCSRRGVKIRSAWSSKRSTERDIKDYPKFRDA